MKRVLIINADDCNLTPGVTRAILDCHDRGILTSTTFMANLPVQKEDVSRLLKRKNLGIGIHLNVTFGKPLSRPARVPSLLNSGAGFKKVHDQISRLPAAAELLREYQAQIDRFAEMFGRKPTHLDTHHQVHDHPFFLKAFVEVARKNELPVRRSALKITSVRTPDFFFGNLSPAGYWTREPLVTILRNLPVGVSEIMCHPGRHDRALEQVSSFREGRQKEWALFRSSFLKTILEQAEIVPAHFGCAILFR